ncbi:GrpB family protein [Actinocatenispora sera]|uniref:GrpB family protein n=1 Tax=Actinocatenispora sera TaxID=390989 RepID=UPI0033E4899D
MRVPPLPDPANQLSRERIAAGAVGDRSVDVPAAAITMTPYDPAWPSLFARERVRIRAALGAHAIAVEHVGSTAVPGLAAKNRVDIDLIVPDPADEPAYLPVLEPLGYVLRTREPAWYQHRCCWNDGHTVNLHVFGPDCDEHLRHLIFRDWLRSHPDDRATYQAAKRRAAADQPWSVSAYNARKVTAILDILHKAGLRPPRGDDQEANLRPSPGW